MLKLLVPVDGSRCAVRAVQEAIKQALWADGDSEIHLLNVQLPIDSFLAKAFLSSDDIQDYQEGEHQLAFNTVLPLLNVSGIPYREARRVGQDAAEIARYAQAQQCQRIIMGTRGLGVIGSVFMGSVAHKVIHLAQVPVTLVK